MEKTFDQMVFVGDLGFCGDLHAVERKEAGCTGESTSGPEVGWLSLSVLPDDSLEDEGDCVEVRLVENSFGQSRRLAP